MPEHPTPANLSGYFNAAVAAIRNAPPDRDGTWQIWDGQDWQDVAQAGPERGEVTGGR
ncbi:hypothetical protein Van01_54190 [Micromonospora andamanensis]|uniref:DUF2510 domain-containing protein n=1 Tax=Micromonospora andamanensis TaxID=1287068 RepID=A0ABQ4I2R7_9ACTN|nr:hypothetical protein Van01_54190 [Micromonospora andamanensis]